jgi:hypothetical protein
MSGLVKSVKKVFKKVTKFVKKYWKVIAIAAAVYFTAGVALSYFGSTAGFASAMPGFGSGGMLSKAAVWMGFKGSAGVASGLSTTSGLWAGSAAAKMGTTLAASNAALGAPVAVTGTKVAAGGTIAQAQAASAATAAAGAGAAGSTVAAATGTDAVIKAMSTAYKLQAASTLISTASGLLAPSEDEINKKQHARQYGNAFGVGRDGNAQYGWASTGGSDAFANMGLPAAARYGEAPQQQRAGSQYASAGGEDFLNSPYNQQSGAEANPYTNMDAGQADFLQMPQQGVA